MAQRPTTWYLTIRKGPKTGSAYPLPAGSINIGRQADNQIVIDDPMVSRHHARFTWQGNTFLVEDLGSANGTWVNDLRISSPVSLRSGDVVGLSQEVLLLFSDRPYADETMYDASARAGAAPVAVRQPSAPVAAPPPPPPPVAEPAARGAQGWLAFGLGGVMAILAVVAVIVLGLVIYMLVWKPAQTASPQAALPALTPIPTATPYPSDTPVPTQVPTATPYPTYTPVPTEVPTATPYPTYTPVPTEVPTATPYPTYTPVPTEVPTATPYPTYTPYPTATPVPRPPQPPTDTPVPTAAPRSPYVISLGNNVQYEPWGRPTQPSGCQGPYDDKSPVRRFTVETILTNNSNNFVTFQTPTFVSASGAALPSCYWAYDPNNPKLEVAQPGESKNVTFGTHLETGDYVRALVFDLPGWTITVCLNGAGQQIPCD